jgi:hypothetical protein
MPTPAWPPLAVTCPSPLKPPDTVGKAKLKPPLVDSRIGALRPLAIDGPRGRLHVRELPAGTHEEIRTLILHEQRASPARPASMPCALSGSPSAVRKRSGYSRPAGPTTRSPRELRISPATVEKHLEHVYRTLGVSSRAQALVRVYAPTGCQAVLSSVTACSRSSASPVASS